MISVTIKMHTHVPYDYDKYSEAMFRFAKEFHNALAEGLKSTYSADFAWVAINSDVIISFRPCNLRSQFNNMPSGTVITECMCLTIITNNFKILNMYVDRAIDVINRFKYYPIFNVAISGDECEQ